MRNHPKFVPELDIVAELNGKIVGNVVCLKSFIMADDGNQYEVLSLGPFLFFPNINRKVLEEKWLRWPKNELSIWDFVPFYFAVTRIITSGKDSFLLKH